MSHIALTGAGGFLGWHTRCAALSAGIASRPFGVGDRFDRSEALSAIGGASRVIHVATAREGSGSEEASGSATCTAQVARALVTCEAPPRVVVYASTNHLGDGQADSQGEARAAEVLAAAADEVGADFVYAELPTVFGEHETPFHGSLVASICHMLANGVSPTVAHNSELRLLHAQDAADLLLGLEPRSTVPENAVTGGEVLELLTSLAATYAMGELPSVQTALERNLFHTFRSFALAGGATVALRPRVDQRGSLVEVVRSHGGASQFSFSTTRPGHSRANHFHRRKIERIVPVGGAALISMRRLFHDETIAVRVRAHSAVAVDVPTLWAHRVDNDGDGDLHLVFWADALLDRDNPDTHADTI